MTESDPKDERARLLFEAARAERPDDSTRTRTLAAMRQVRASHAVDATESVLGPPPEAARPRRFRRTAYAVAALAALVLSFVVVRARREPALSISPERRLAERAMHAPGPDESAARVAPEVSSGIALPPPPPKHEPARRRQVTSVEEPVETPSASAPALRAPASLSEEVAALDRARAALNGGNPTAALQALDDYSGVLRGARLAEEATLLRIEVLKRLGRADAASKLASDFIRTNPSSPLAERARGFVEATPGIGSRGVGLGLDAGGSK